MSGSKLASVPVSRRTLTPEERTQKRAESLARVARLIGRLQDENYFGKITVNLQDGNIVDIRTEQVLKIGDF